MTTPPHTGPRKIIAAALDDWWLTTDPSRPPDTTDAAETVEMYLLSSGYRITPDTRKAPHTMPVPSRGTVIGAGALALLCAITAVLAALRGDTAWATLGTIGAALLTYETARDARDRRRGRAAR
ncbi:hypothetical protein ABZX40_36465 [Streptomyces sp. NPDC004610]|uniref:hypothetical protein n=1 Tax=unclassified Streptomyces TaxID=2593676 RepID=UPI0033ADC31C